MMVKRGVSSKGKDVISYAAAVDLKNCPHCEKVVSMKTVKDKDNKCPYCDKTIEKTEE
jgi:uncharacterized paraquat-inducible protein A